MCAVLLQAACRVAAVLPQVSQARDETGVLSMHADGLCRQSHVRDETALRAALSSNPLLGSSHTYWCAACHVLDKLQHLFLAQLLERLLSMPHA